MDDIILLSRIKESRVIEVFNELFGEWTKNHEERVATSDVISIA